MILVNAFVSLAVICSAVIGSPVYSSSVYVKSGPDVLPLEYVEYAPSFSIPRAQLAQLTASPVGSVVGYPSSVSYQGFAPCVSPCVYDTVATVPQLPAPNAKIVTYQPSLPKVSVGYVPKDEPRGYEYSYLVYDEGTGDQKAQHESSDGGVVRGQYSLLQPDGYVREVQYSAGDDGFNAVVKNFRPKSETDKAELKEEKKEEAPCDKEKEKESVEASSETSEEPKKETQEIVETSSESNESAEPSSAKPPPAPAPVENKIYLTFQDLVRCAQLAGKAAAEEKPSAETPETSVETIDNVPEKSALTYIVIPSLNAPC